MAKAILEFDLNEPEDRQDHLRSVNSLNMALAIWDIVHNTKKTLEWSFDGKEMDKYDALEAVYEKIHDILNEHNVNIDQLIN